MKRLAFAVAVGLAFVSGALAPAPARADVHISVDKASQRMTVAVDGRVQHVWTVSTGKDGGPPLGAFRPERMHKTYFSRTYDNAPMPHSIFFYHGYAIHGTDQVGRLGRRASKGCVRLHPRNAALLFALVKEHGMARTRVVISERSFLAEKDRPGSERKVAERRASERKMQDRVMDRRVMERRMMDRRVMERSLRDGRLVASARR